MLIEDNPKFHLHGGTLTSWAVQPDTLRYLYSLLSPDMSTLETGCGQTTVVFLIAGTSHICVSSETGEVDRVKQYCQKLNLKDTITFLTESSDKVLPHKEKIPSQFDLVFIDGAHGFPAPIIDWYYTAHRLKVGGIVAVDDYRMPSVKILYNFLCGEDEWKLIKVKQNTAFFKKLRELKPIVDWSGQRINSSFNDNAKKAEKYPLVAKLMSFRWIGTMRQIISFLKRK